MSKDTFTLNIPISKIDEEKRIVTGIATSEALDSQGDIVDYEASKKAFSDWPGNIREMHGDKAVGKGIDVQFDDKKKQVIVSAKISESADGENAWIKVKEKVLTGFSIGGRVFEVVKDKAVEGANRVTDYTLSELSLVDNPACPDAQLIMVKSADGGLQRVEDMKKSVWDAGMAISLATELSYLIMSEQFDDESDASQVADLVEAFNRLRDFAAKEVSEGDDYVLESQGVIELARRAINLRKGTRMSEVKKDEVEVVKSTAVQASEERDENAEVVTTAEENTPVAAPAAESAEEKPAEEVVAEEATEEKAEEAKSDDATDLVKSVQSLIAKLGEQKNDDLTKMSDLVKELGAKVEKSITSLEERIATLEKQPVESKTKASFVVDKGGKIEVAADLDALYKRQDELAAHPELAAPGEMQSLFTDIRKALNNK